MFPLNHWHKFICTVVEPDLTSRLSSMCTHVRECSWQSSVYGQLATLWAPRLQSIRDPRWQLLCQMGFSWRLQPLSVTRSHVFVFVVDEVRVRAVCNKAVCALLCVQVCAWGSWAKVQREHVQMPHGAGWNMTELSLESCRGKKGEEVLRCGVKLVPHRCSSYCNMNSCGTDLIYLFSVARAG